MARNSQYDDVCKIIRQLVKAPSDINNIVYDCRIPYPTVRKLMKDSFPHCFREKPHMGWVWTGASPIQDVPFIPYETPVEPETKHAEPTRNRSSTGWVWNQDALRFLDSLFPGHTFKEVLLDMQKQQKLEDLSIIGKTMARAADQMRKTGRLPF